MKFRRKKSNLLLDLKSNLSRYNIYFYFRVFFFNKNNSHLRTLSYFSFFCVCVYGGGGGCLEIGI